MAATRLGALMLLLVAASWVQTARAQLGIWNCLSTWTRHNDYCYLYSATGRAWQDAENFCRAYNGHLASFHSDTENNWMLQLTSNPYCWIGVNDIASEGTYVNVDGTAMDYSKWNSGEPNNYNNEDCIHITGAGGNVCVWNDLGCGSALCSICMARPGTLLKFFSCGFNAWLNYDIGWQSLVSGGCHYWINGVLYNPPTGRGFSVYVFDYATAYNGHAGYGVFDTYGDGAAAGNMINYLNGISNGQLVAVLCFDECVNQLGATAKAYIANICGGEINNLAFRDGYMCVYTKGSIVHYVVRHQTMCQSTEILIPSVASCPAGKYQSDVRCIDCPAGKYSSSTGATSSAVCQLCPAGKYGSATGMTSSACTASCSAGYYCGAGSTSATQTICPAGVYGTSGVGTASCSAACPAGKYCPAGTKDTDLVNLPCNAGRYSTGGATAASCQADCDAGYICAPGSTTARPAECGGIDRYCPAGSGAATIATAGYYTTGATTTTRTGQAACPIGYYCTGGDQFMCPAGRYNDQTGQTACSKLCSAGYFCDVGSTADMRAACGAGTCAAKPAACFCPAGTATRQTVATGYYTTGTDMNDITHRSGQAICTSAYTCTDGIRVANAAWNDCVSVGGATATTARSVPESTLTAVGAAVTAVMPGTPAYSVATPVANAGCTWTTAPTVSVGAANGQLSVTANPPNYENCAGFSVLLTVQDGTTSMQCKVLVTVIDVNEAPSLTNCATARSVSEQSPKATTVGAPVAVSDPDIGQASYFSITGGTGQSKFTISPCSGQILVNDPKILYTAAQSYTLTVRVDDDGSPVLSNTCSLVVTILDINDPPDVLDATFSIAENSAYSTLVGTFVATDPDGDALTWTLTATNPPNMFFVTSNGQLRVNGNLDYETAGYFAFRVTVDDKRGGLDTANVIVTITDVNDAPVVTGTTLGVAENSAVGTVVGTITATDQDTGDVVTLSITAGNTGNAFSFSGKNLQVATAVLDYEALSSYTLTVKATDKGGLFSTATVIVQLSDVNEAPTFASVARSVAEDAAIGAAVGSSLGATDPDAGQTAFLVYSINSGNTNNAFTIDTAGVLRVAAALDFETLPSYSLSVKVRDAGGLTATATVTVTVTDVNEPPTIAAGTSRTVNENSAVGTLVGAVLTATDPEKTTSFTWSLLSGNDGTTFALSSTAGQLSVANNYMLDYESRKSFILTVRVADAGGAFSTQTITINVANVNEAPVWDYAPGTVVSLAIVERSVAGTTIGTRVTATDPDGDTITYSVQTQPAGNYYRVDGATGQVVVNTVLPAVNGGALTHNIVVRASDPSGATADQSVSILVMDQNDPPVYNDATRSVPENSPINTLVGLPVTATDPDTTDVLIYSIASGVSQSEFTINANTGQLVVGNPILDFETTPSYSLRLIAKDTRTIGSMSDDCIVTITVQDMPEAPVLANAARSVNENSAVGTNVGLPVTGTDPDAGQTALLSYSLISGSTDLFAITATTGQVTVKSAVLDFEKTQTYVLGIQVTDPTARTASATLTISILNVNDPPTFPAFTAVSVREDAVVGYLIGAFVGSDQDGDALTYTILSGNTGNVFSLAATTAQLTVSAPLDFETRASYALSIKVTDPSGTSATTSITVNVLDVNEPPVANSWAAASLPESAAVGTTVATVTFKDPDAGTTLTYRISDGNIDSAFTINTATGVVSTAKSLNFEAISSYSLEVTAVDQGGLSGAGRLTVGVTDVNEAPTMLASTQSVPENSPTGTNIGVPLVALDPDAGETLTYTITAGNSGSLFTIAGSQLKVGTALLDYETVPTYTIQVKVTDKGGLTSTATITISVVNVNEAPIINDATRRLNENSAVNFRIGDPLPASDQDVGQILAYAIVSGNELKHFKINPCDGQLQVNTAAVNFEALSSYTLVVSVTDDGVDPGPPHLSDTATVVITVDNVNEAPVVNDLAVSVLENKAVGFVFGTMTVNEPDFKDVPAQTQTYAIVAGNEDGFFAINPATGAVSIARVGLDFETRTAYPLVISATDSGVPPLSNTGNCAITILDANEPPIVAAQSRSIAENSAAGTLIGAPLVATDPDAGVNGVLSFSVPTTVPFTVDAVSGQLKVKSALDFETQSKYTFTLTVTDGGGLSTPATITVNILDVNEAPVLSATSFTIDENSARGTAIGTVKATDVDNGQVLSYTIIAQTPSTAFAIGPLSGIVTVADALLNFEAQTTYTITVQVVDSGTPALSASGLVTINVANVWEAPVITAGQSRSVPESAVVGTLLGGILTASDEDSGDQWTFAISSGNLGVAFGVSSNGQLSVTGPLNFEVLARYTLLVVATDSHGKASVPTAVTIDVTDVNEAPTFATSSFTGSVPEDAAVGVRVTILTATDQDAGNVLTWSLVSDPSGAFSVLPATGDLLIKTSGIISAKIQYTLSVRVQDQAGLSNTASVVVTVTDINHPPKVSDAARSVPENSATGVNVGAPLTATDPENDQLTWRIQSGNDNGAFAINPSTGQLTVATTSALDYEARSWQLIKVEVRDNGPGTLASYANVNITITNVNEAPSVVAGTLSVKENTPVGTSVGKVVASDPDRGDALTYAITAGNTGNVFAISNTGAVTVAIATLNAEAIASYTLTVTVTDKLGLKGSGTITVTIEDVNDAPVFKDTTRSVPENSPAGTLVGVQLAVTDEDLIRGIQKLTFTITSGNTGNAFAVSNAGQITVAGLLNFEALAQYTLVIAVTDDGTPALGTSATVVISVTDVNEVPTFGAASYTATIQENSATGTRVTMSGGAISATDPELAYQTITFSIAGESIFAINPTTGVVSLRTPVLDFETRSSYDIVLQATDSAASPLTGTASLRVNIVDVNEVPVWNAVPALTVKENSLVGVRVTGVVSASDVDAGTNGQLQYSITGGDGSAVFSIDKDTAVLSVKSATLNFEVKSSYSLDLKVVDGGGLQALLTVQVKLLDVNEPPVLLPGERSVPENSPESTPVGFAITGSDVDAGQTMTLAYSITGGDGAGIFIINACSGQVIVRQEVLDYETKSSYTLQVTVTDDDTLDPPHLTATATYTIKLIDVNEAPKISSAARAVDENSAVGTNVGVALVATDEDRPAQPLSFSFDSGNDAGLFAVANNGQVTVAATGLNFEQQSQYTLVVRVADDKGLFATASLTISINNVNEAPVLAPVTCSVPENSAANVLVCEIVATDEDSGQALSYVLNAAGNTGSVFSLTSGNSRGRLLVAGSLDFEAIPVFTLSVSVTDDGMIGGSQMTPITITVPTTVNIVNVNEAPSIAAQQRSVKENSPLATPVGAALIASDPDAGTFLTFTILSGNSDGLFGIVAQTGQLTVAIPANYEARNAYDLVVQVTDSGFSSQLTASAHIAVSIEDVNEMPIITGSSLTVSENVQFGTKLQPAAGYNQIGATDVDAADQTGLAFSILSGNDQGLFRVDAVTGELFTVPKVSMDYETQSAYNLLLQVTDHGGLFSTAPVSIAVQDINEAPWLDVPAVNVSMRAQMPANSLVTKYVGRDQDAGDVLQFFLQGPNADLFTINAARGELYIALPDDPRAVFVTGAANQINLQVGVRDRAGLTGIRSLFINIIDNNNPPSLNGASFDIPENSAFGTRIGSVAGTDKDASQRLAYTVLSVTPEAAAPLFTLTTTTNPAGGKEIGVLTVADTSRLANPPKLDYETFKTVSLVVQVTDNGPGLLTATATVVVRLTDVNEPPSIALAAADAAGVQYVDENVAVGTQVGDRLIWSDPDAQDTVLALSLAWNEAANGATLPFSIDATGQVYVSRAALNYEAKTRYNVRATAVDHSGVTAKVDFAIAINNVNEAPVMAAFTMAVDENSAVGVAVGQLSASDVDAGTVFKFQFAPGTESNAASSLFAINPATGAVTVAVADLDFERTQSYIITVRVRDNGLGVESLSLYADAQLTISIRDVNDVAITGFNVDGSGVAATVAHPTDVPQRVTILGRDFGPVAPTSAVVVTATYASASRPGQIYTATGCQVTTANTVIQCFTVPGAGTALTWTLTVNGASTTSTMTTSYAAPMITAVTGAGALATRGGNTIVLAGSNFGPATTAVEAVVYGPSGDGTGMFRYRATDCTITTAHTRITCKTAPGVGASLQWRVTIERLASVPFIGADTSYATPSIASIDGGDSLGTQGGEIVVLTGTDFGRAVDGTVVATYGAAGTGLAAVGCVVVTDHSVIRCQTAAGVGAQHSWIVRVGDIASKPSAAKTSYKAPVISEVSGAGFQDAATRGLEDLYVTGTSFGPTTTVPVVQYGGVNANLYTAQSCVVSQAHSRIVCKTAEGTGRGHSVRVQIGGQWSAIAAVGQSYAAPMIVDYSGEGAIDALTKGGQAVLIEGRNFGSVAHDKVDLVMYGRNASKLEFVARDCHVVTSHTFIRCSTAPGAGAGLKWSVIIDGQKSGSPTTNYAEPSVDAVVGPGAVNARTDGGQQFTILGNNFGPAGKPTFLELVTYGVTGVEYTADKCAVVNHTAISCFTVPGVGANLRVRVTVYSQVSAPGGLMSYAAPRIVTASTLRGSTTGGTVVSLTGTNFGMATFLAGLRSSLVRLTFGGQLLEDGTVVTGYASDKGVHSLQFTVPEAVTFGRDREIQIQVVDLRGNGQTSNVLVFQYDDPVITGVFRLRNNVLRIEGANFGIDGTVTATTKAGVTTVIPKSSATTYVHTLIEVSLDAVAGTVVVARGEQESNIGYFATVVPTISALKSDGAGGELFFSTEGGETLTVSGYDMGEQDKLSDVNITVSTQNARGVIVGKPCAITKFVNIPGELIPGTTQKADDQQIITCRTPPGQGENQRVSVIVRGNASPASRINYEQPWIQTIATNFGDGTLTPTSGKHPNGQSVRVKLTGRNFGLANQTVFLYRCADQSDIQNCEYMMIASNCQFTQRTAECDMPEGEGRGLFASIIISTGGDPSLIYDNPKGQYRHATVPTGAYGFRDGHRVTIDCAEPHVVVSGRRLAGGSTVLSQTGPTTGGFLLTLNGENFGRSTETISVTVGTYTCDVVSHTHTSVTCKMPAGQGANLPVTVTVKGVSNSDKPLFSYLPPVIGGLSTTHGPTSGMPVGSVKRQNITITGTNFGKSGTVTFGANPADEYQDDVVVPAADVFVWTHNNIVLAMPPGQGKGRVVTVKVGSQVSGATGFDYDDPIVDHIIPDTDATQDDFLPTDGLYNVTVIGRNFGTHFGAVVLTHTRLDAGFRCGGDGKSYQSSCAINAGLQSHTSMRFLMPRGVGKNFQLRVQVGKQQSGYILQSYDAPAITRVRPNQADALGQLLLIDGKNFGDSSVGLNISVHSTQCDNPQFIAGSVLPGTGFVQPPFLQCVMRTGTVGWKNITVAIAGQEVTVHWSSALLLAMCQRNFYGEMGELCLPCMLGGYCDGGLTPPVSIKGFWMQNATEEQCPAERLPPYVSKEFCLQAVACEPQTACTGNNQCGFGYAGERCALCAKQFYRRAGECIKCPDQPLLLVLGFVGAAIVLCCVGYILNKKSVNLAFVSIGVDYFQVLALFANSKIVWPPTLKQLFVYMSAFNFNLEITAPECSIPDLGYSNKWYMIMSLPLAAITMFLLMHFGMVAHKFIILGRRKNLNKHASAFVSTGMVMFYYLYLYLTRTALDIFNCAPTTPPDGHTYLEVVFERCDKPGGIHEKLLPLAVIAFIVYSLGFPSVLFAMLYRNRLLIMEDQLLRANGTGQDRLTNPHAYDCRKRYHKLYYHFKPDQWFWILAVIMRKGFLAFTALMFNKNPAFQLAMALLVMFLAYTAQVKYRPYMSVSENQEVLRDHQYKAELGNYNHQLLAANLSKVQARSKARTTKFSWEAALGSRKAAVAAAAAARYFWNYNTVEMVLLFCAVLVNLAGVMFSSGQLDSDFYSSYRETITWAVILVIVTSVCYFFFVLGSEVYGTICQDKIAKKATSKDSKKADMARKNVDLFAEANADKMDMAGFVNPYFKAAGSSAPVQTGPQTPAQLIEGAQQQVIKLRMDNAELEANIAALRSQLEALQGGSEGGAPATAEGEVPAASDSGAAPVAAAARAPAFVARGRGRGRGRGAAASRAGGRAKPAEDADAVAS